jgi:ELWxxDGT repeat protein
MTSLVFSADDGSTGRELWTTNGTAAGTDLLADIWPGGGPSNPSYFTPLGDGRLVFAAADPAHNTELWVTDGTTAGTRLVLDINTASSGFAASYPSSFAFLENGRALFMASDPEHGNEPWVTDGTAEGTRVLETNPGPDYSYLSGAFTALGDGRALFSVGDRDRGSELWVTDGTQEGTALVADIYPGPNGSYPGSGYSGAPGMIALGDGRAIFGADDGANGRELWISDGTGSRTYLLADLWPGAYNPYPGSGDYPNSSSPTNFVALGNGQILFTAADPDHGTELWTTDGTASGTRIVADLWTGTSIPYSGANPVAASSRPDNIVAFGGGRALFAAEDGVHGRELWITDGTEAGTYLLRDLWEGGGSGNPGEGGSYYYSPSPPYGPPPYGPNYGPGGIFVTGDGRALFSATDPVHGNELWVTDGTPDGTRLVEDINRNVQGFASSGPSYFAALDDGRVVFTADDGSNGVEPWITDGTTEGTHLLRNINPGAGSSGASGFVPVWPVGGDATPSTDGWFAA